MIFFFVVGVEGTGHHMTGAVLSNYAKRQDSVFEGEWHQLLIDHWDCETRWKKSQQKAVFSKRQELAKDLNNIFKKYKSQKIINLFEYTSFPYEQPREALRRPDIIEFSQLMAEFKDFIDVKYLILYRNPIAATYSAIRRGFTDNIYLQSRIVESNFIYIERQFGNIYPQSYRVIHFEEFLDKPEEHLEKLADWWNLDHETVSEGLTKLRMPSGLSKIPKEEKEFLEGFFNSKRIDQWKEFYDSNRL